MLALALTLILAVVAYFLVVTLVDVHPLNNVPAPSAPSNAPRSP